MLMISFMMSNLMTAIIFTQLNHPLAMTLLILIQTLLICLITGMISQSFWFSYILFLVFLGGMLVLFIYITALASNEMFNIPTKFLLITTFVLSTFIMIFMFIDKSSTSIMLSNLDMITMINNMNLLNNDSTLSLTKLYNKPTDFITLLLVMYLFLTLIAIVTITNIFQGPLRQKN
uniref:NADH dehydrogenase subunit 6 n=1 Tax=Stenopelmatus typhlops TaxID=2840320 RepID=UPI0023D7F7E3|nr:NADH dehydrogenase subunit 6 [Stenopelmatus typhlops]WDE73785.1 NADH dehydrogenase subunit 6 [Stenopelmatus typhlops]